jgi:hypothetical protein
MISIKNYKYKIEASLCFLVTFLVFIIGPLSCQAFTFEEIFDEFEKWFSGESNNSQIINEINVSTETGNKTINGENPPAGGEGETKTKIEIKNIVNGTEIEPIDIESEANEVKVESEINVDGDTAQVEREIEIDSEKSIENYEVELENSEAETKDLAEEELRIALQGWWSDFVEDLESFFQNIFNIF